MAVYSYSRIGCFENCPRQYKFRYIEKPDIVKPEGVEAFMGKMVHETLEQCHKLAMAGRVWSRDQLIADYETRWQEKIPDTIQVVKKDMRVEDYRNIGRMALERYHDRYAPFDQETTIGLERRVNFNLDSAGRYKMMGFIDRLTRNASGRLRIQDYKTSGTLPTQPEIDAEAQLALYQIAIEEMWPDNDGIELVWHFLQFDTTLTSRRSPEQLRELREAYIAKIRKIETAEELGNFPTNETSLCNWCEYYDLCPAKNQKVIEAGVQQELAIPAADDTAELVDRYLDLDDRKKALEADLKEIKENLIGRGEPGSSTLLRGTNDSEGIMITRSTALKLPGKSATDALASLTAIMRDAGLFDTYASLDTGALQKALENGALPESIADEVRGFATTVASGTLRRKKL